MNFDGFRPGLPQDRCPTHAEAAISSDFDRRTVPTPETAPVRFAVTQTSGASVAPRYTPAAPDASGGIVLTHGTPSAPYPVAGVRTVLSSSSEQTCKMSVDQPLSCVWRQTSRSSWTRDQWDCAVEASYELRADMDAFHLVETLRATERGEEVFARTHRASIPRDLL
jgi:hypothetical protein